jgi:hypothetical protein
VYSSGPWESPGPEETKRTDSRTRDQRGQDPSQSPLLMLGISDTRPAWPRPGQVTVRCSWLLLQDILSKSPFPPVQSGDNGIPASEDCWEVK